MMPRLIAISGMLRPSTFNLAGEEFSIGRDVNNDLTINDLSVSRKHCLVKQEAGRFKLYDLNSHNKTFINDSPSTAQFLNHGDRIKIGNSLFIFLLHETEATQPADRVQLDESNLVTGTALKIPTADALAYMAHDFSVLMDISLKISTIKGVRALQQHLLERVFEVVPADCGAILLVGEGPEEFESKFGIDRHNGQGKDVRVSMTIARQVLLEGVAILSNNVLETGEFGASQSIVSSRIQSLLCVPIVMLDKPIGVIYLDTQNPNVRFDKSQMQMIIAIANIAAGVLSNALHAERLESENRHLHTVINLQHDMVGDSERMLELYQIIAKIAPTDITVLISGESGTGKELAARAIHKNSQRAKRPFVALNCAALAESLLDSELFGHEKGAFTDARAQKKGPLELADGGTMFLDEVGELSQQAQAKLLRVIQEREVVRVGNTTPIKFDVRFIAATNKNLQEEVERETFRKDLYFRLNMFPLEMPPLRERREDILLLAKYFMRKYEEKYKRGIKGFSAETHARLISYGWPGNVRELENVIAYAVALCSTDYILPEHLPKSIHAATRYSVDRPYLELIKEAKRRIILEALQKAGGDHAAAARVLHIHPNNLHRLIRTLNLRDARGTRN